MQTTTKIYTIGDFNINLYLKNLYIFFLKKELFQSRSIPSDIKNYYKLCTVFGLK